MVEIKGKRGFPLPPSHLRAGRTSQAYRVPTQAKAFAKIIIYIQSKKNGTKKYKNANAMSFVFLLWGGLCWDSSSDRSLDDDALVDYYHCMRCGTSYEVFQPNEEEKEDYKEYWQHKTET